LTVPIHAILEKDSKKFVLVRDDSNRLIPKQVELGEANDTRVQVISGVEEGESVAVNAQDLATAVFDDKPSSDSSI
jgi:multidrug efflux pump subunit AcrA (membrane-fusion protein)